MRLLFVIPILLLGLGCDRKQVQKMQHPGVQSPAHSLTHWIPK